VGDQYETDGEERRWAGLQPPVESQPMFNVPTVILVLIGLFALVHAGRSFLSPESDLVFLIEMAFIPARYVEGLLGSGLEGFTSFVTYNFLHGDLAHLGVNSIWMLAMGSAVAKRVGTLRFLLFSLICGMFAALAHLLTHFGEIVPVIGASGAISGHMAAAIRFIFSVPEGEHGAGMIHGNLRAIPLKPLSHSLKDGRVIAILAIWLLTNVVSGVGIIEVGAGESPIAWEAHIGGFVAGLLLFSLFDLPGNGKHEPGEPGEGLREDDKGPWFDPDDERSDQNNGSS
jgi:membrane associated rhomboid family serine protease